MRAAPAAVVSFLAANNVCWRADLFTVTPLGGTPLRWTSFDRSLTVGGNTFLADGAVIGRTDFRQSSRLEIDTLSLSLNGQYVMPDGRKLGLAAQQGYFKGGARLQLDHLIMPSPGDVSLGAIPSLFEGFVSDIAPDPLVTVLTASCDLDLLKQTPVPKHSFQPQCTYALYDSATCGISRAAFTSTGTVSASPAPTALSFKTGLAQASNYFNLGAIQFTSGALSGQRRNVRTYVSGQVTVSQAFSQAPAVGDAFSIYPGCDKSKADCNTKFANLGRFRGFTNIPLGGVV